MKTQIPLEEFKPAIKSLNNSLKATGERPIKLKGAKKAQIIEEFINTILDYINQDKTENLPDNVVHFYNKYIADDDDEQEEWENFDTKQTSDKPYGKMAAYQRRLQDKKHLQEIKFEFEGLTSEIKEIVKAFGESTTEYVDDKECYRFVTPLNISLKQMAADFGYCYEKFEKWIQRSYSRKEWGELRVKFERLRINELYHCVTPDANISCIYKLPTYLFLDKGKLSGNEFKVLCAFKARSKRKPELGGMRVSGWGPSGLVRELGLKSRDTARNCIRTLERKKFIKIIPALSTKTKKIYQVFV